MEIFPRSLLRLQMMQVAGGVYFERLHRNDAMRAMLRSLSLDTSAGEFLLLLDLSRYHTRHALEVEYSIL